ncbi:hypothetical protein NC651_033486 [Populus alba x Populus x berolinensis]|nr:hypothetical protein NC651_033486 [Populus alba x Populus x berolinensis]
MDHFVWSPNTRVECLLYKENHKKIWQVY